MSEHEVNGAEAPEDAPAESDAPDPADGAPGVRTAADDAPGAPAPPEARAPYRALYRRSSEQTSLFPELDDRGTDRPTPAPPTDTAESDPVGDAAERTPPTTTADADSSRRETRSGSPIEPSPLADLLASLDRSAPPGRQPREGDDTGDDTGDDGDGAATARTAGVPTADSAARLDRTLTRIFAGLAARADPTAALAGPQLTEPPPVDTGGPATRLAATAGGLPAPPPGSIPVLHLTDAGLPRRDTSVAASVASDRAEEAASALQAALDRHHRHTGAARGTVVRRVDDDGPARLDDDVVNRLETALGPMFADAADARDQDDPATSDRPPAPTPHEPGVVAPALPRRTSVGVSEVPDSDVADSEGDGDVIAFPRDATAPAPATGRRRERRRRGWAAALIVAVGGGAGVGYALARDGPSASDEPATTVDPADASVAQLSTADAGAGGTRSPVAVTLEADFDGAGNEEWVRIANEEAEPIDLAGWSLRDDGFTNLFQFDERVLEPGTTVTLYSGCGVDTVTELYWCTTPDDVWDDDADVATLFDDDQLVVDVLRD